MEDKISNEKINKSQNGYKKISGYKEKTKSSFGKSVFVPFITSIIGATLVVGVCFGVPEIKNKIINYPVRCDSKHRYSISCKYCNFIIRLF